MADRVDPRRSAPLNDRAPQPGPVVYWMSRDQRVRDNWALLQAQDLALELGQPLVVVFCLVPDYLGALPGQYRFMLQGLAGVEEDLEKLAIGFSVLSGSPESEIPRFCRSIGAGSLISDFNPLRINRLWKAGLSKNLKLAHIEVDAHNIVPCRIASPKQEYAAYTFRPKIKKLLPLFLTDLPALNRHPFRLEVNPSRAGLTAAERLSALDSPADPGYGFTSGEGAAHRAMQLFIENKLAGYETDRNNPVLDGQSNLSPYLHFGQLGAQRLAYLVRQAEAPGVHTEAYLEELIVRRELSDNFCFYNEKYDSVDSFPRWAGETLAEHAADHREYLYGREEFEAALTHDPLWNSAQLQMINTGKMHGYMRMYWAKKILEWTENPQQALEIAIYLNDRYSLDGRDPNGYAGIAWSIGGVHDRAWFQRPVFGKIRYMSYRGCRSKFDVDQYIEMNRSFQDGG